MESERNGCSGWLTAITNLLPLDDKVRKLAIFRLSRPLNFQEKPRAPKDSMEGQQIVLLKQEILFRGRWGSVFIPSILLYVESVNGNHILAKLQYSNRVSRLELFSYTITS